MYEKVRHANAPRTIVISERQDARIELRAGDLRWNDFLSPNEQFEAVPCAPDESINVIFSSGTTGDPKAIPWDHTTPIKCGSDGMYHQDIRPGDMVCWPTNLGWMMGPWLVFAGLLNRATIALYEGAPTERGFCEFVQDAKATMLGLVPSIVKSWRSTGAAEGFDWSHLRTYSSSGEASDPHDYGWLMKLNQPDGSSRPIIEYCGGTEIGGGYVTSTVVEAHRPSEFNAKAMGSDFVVLNEECKTCIAGEAGEVFIRPPSIGLSARLLNADNDAVYYANCPVIDERPLRRHGDQLMVVEEGRYRSNGRADDAMNLGGIKVGSAEIERTLEQRGWCGGNGSGRRHISRGWPRPVGSLCRDEARERVAPCRGAEESHAAGDTRSPEPALSPRRRGDCRQSAAHRLQQSDAQSFAQSVCRGTECERHQVAGSRAPAAGAASFAAYPAAKLGPPATHSLFRRRASLSSLRLRRAYARSFPACAAGARGLQENPRRPSPGWTGTWGRTCSGTPA